MKFPVSVMSLLCLHVFCRSCPNIATKTSGTQGRIDQAPVVQRLDIHQINRYPVDRCLQDKPCYPVDSDLSGG